MLEKLLMNPWVIFGAVTAALCLAAKFADPEKAYQVGKSRGRLITSAMRKTRLGAKAWEKIEDFAQRLILAYIKGFMDGLDEDDGDRPDQPLAPDQAVAPRPPQ